MRVCINLNIHTPIARMQISSYTFIYVCHMYIHTCLCAFLLKVHTKNAGVNFIPAPRRPRRQRRKLIEFHAQTGRQRDFS